MQAPARKIVPGIEPEPEFVVQRRPERERPPAPRPAAVNVVDLTPTTATVSIPPPPTVATPATTAPDVTTPVASVVDTRRRPPTPVEDDEDVAETVTARDVEEEEAVPIVFKPGKSEPVISPKRPEAEEVKPSQVQPSQASVEREPVRLVTPQRVRELAIDSFFARPTLPAVGFPFFCPTC